MKPIFLIIYSFLLLSACHSTKSTQPEILKPLPATYLQKQDSLNGAKINWKDFFTDKTLIALIDSTLQHNWDAKIACQRIELARSDVRFARAALSPTMGVGAVGAIRRYGLYTMDGAGNSTTDILPGKTVPVNLPDYIVGFQSSWEADITGKLHNRKKAAIARYLSSIEGKNWVITNLIAEIAISYYDLLTLDQELEIIRENIILQENALLIVTVQKEAAAATELAVKQFKAQVLNTKSLELEIVQRIVATESRINFLLGRYPQTVIRSADAFENLTPSFMQTGIPSDLLSNRPDIRQARMELAATRADLKAAKAAFYPSLNITGSAGFQAFRTDLLFSTPESFMYSLVGGLSAPLINRNAIKASFNAADARQLEALYNYQKTILNGYAEVYTELNNINNLQKIYDFRNEEVAVLSESIETSSELFRRGRATYLEVLVAQQNTLHTKIDFIEVKRRQLNATVNIYRALGGGWQ